MWKNLNKATTTTIISMLLVVLSFGVIFGAMSGSFRGNEGLQSAGLQGSLTVLALVAGYYYGSSNKDNKTKE